ncbi:MAG: hypothetical protein JNM17_16775 [Archangium sp.]|nr:hypothetical protein [Archangium sp.]
MSFRFYSVPPWNPKETELVPDSSGDLKAALARVEYRGFKAFDRALELVSAKSPAVFASSPNDLPALLRTADQLLTAAKMDAGERAQVWRCSCGTPYAVPVALVRPVSLRCDRCGNTVEMDPSRAGAVESTIDAKTAAVNATRNSLSVFFREAMARGWPVLIAKV